MGLQILASARWRMCLGAAMALKACDGFKLSIAQMWGS